MKISINIIMTTIVLFLVGCNKTVKAPPIEHQELNQTISDINNTTTPTIIISEVPIIIEEEPIVIIEEEPEYDLYDAVYNDESITDGIASKIVIIKSRKVMVVFDEYDNILSRHRISLGKNDIGTKLKRGDYKTPEGVYTVINKRSDKRYYKQIRISYPNEEDRERSKELGFHPGSGITIHAQVPWNWNGNENDYTLARNWTRGCIAMTNEGIDMIWNNVSPQTIIDIRE